MRDIMHEPMVPNLAEGLAGGYYVYALLDTRRKSRKYNGLGYEPFYIGYGKNGRVLQHFKRYRRATCLKNSIIAKILQETGDWPRYKILDSGLTLRQAKQLEIECIARYGRRDLGEGPLANHTDGGDGFKGKRPLKPSIERRRVDRIKATFASKSEEELQAISLKLSAAQKAIHRNSSKGAKARRAKACSEALKARGAQLWKEFVAEHCVSDTLKFSAYISATDPITCTCRTCNAQYVTTPHVIRRRVLAGLALCQPCRRASKLYRQERKASGAVISAVKLANTRKLWQQRNAEYVEFLKHHTSLTTRVKITSTESFYEYQQHRCVTCGEKFNYIPARVFKRQIAKIHHCRR